MRERGLREREGAIRMHQACPAPAPLTEQLYFPDDHKMAVYVPFFVPVLLPVPPHPRPPCLPRPRPRLPYAGSGPALSCRDPPRPRPRPARHPPPATFAAPRTLSQPRGFGCSCMGGEVRGLGARGGWAGMTLTEESGGPAGFCGPRPRGANGRQGSRRRPPRRRRRRRSRRQRGRRQGKVRVNPRALRTRGW